MVTISSHEERMNNRDTQDKKISPEFANLRAKHLEELSDLEDLVRVKSPLPISYDVGRSQPPYFFEYSYTELLGCLYIYPQSSDQAARIVDYASTYENQNNGFDVVGSIMSRQWSDKYNLEKNIARKYERVAFTAGTNIFSDAVSRENLTRQMEYYPETVIKPHPLTAEETIRTMGQAYGYHRILDPLESGWAYLLNAKTILTPSNSEIGLYGFLMNKNVINITNMAYEARAPYNPFYRLLWDKSNEDAKTMLVKLLNSPVSGFLHPHDPDVGSKIDLFFDTTLKLREQFKPLVREYDPIAYALMVTGGPKIPKGVVNNPKLEEKQIALLNRQ